MLEAVLTLQYPPAVIAAKREAIARRWVLSSDGLTGDGTIGLTPGDLRRLCEFYNEEFLNGWFGGFQGQLRFSLSSRLTKSAGKTICPKNIMKMRPQDVVMEIRIGSDFFEKFNEVDGAKLVCGLSARNSLEALQLVMEHELCHVIEFRCFGRSSCKRIRFKTLARQLFDHRESYHQLPTGRQIAQQKFGLRIGDTVWFRFEERRLQGMLYRINKRATVMVRDRQGSYTDRKGGRYTKYYVPIELLER